MENRILENLQHFLITKVKKHIILWTNCSTRVVPVIADDRT